MGARYFGARPDPVVSMSYEGPYARRQHANAWMHDADGQRGRSESLETFYESSVAQGLLDHVVGCLHEPQSVECRGNERFSIAQPEPRLRPQFDGGTVHAKFPRAIAPGCRQTKQHALVSLDIRRPFGLTPGFQISRACAQYEHLLGEGPRDESGVFQRPMRTAASSPSSTRSST